MLGNWSYSCPNWPKIRENFKGSGLSEGSFGSRKKILKIAWKSAKVRPRDGQFWSELVVNRLTIVYAVFQGIQGMVVFFCKEFKDIPVFSRIQGKKSKSEIQVKTPVAPLHMLNPKWSNIPVEQLMQSA